MNTNRVYHSKSNLLLIIALTCALNVNAANAQEPQTAPSARYIHDSHTIGSLASLSEEQLFDLIKVWAITEDCVPTGESAGLPGRMDKNVVGSHNFVKVFFKGLFNILGNKETEFVASQIWKGKVFYRNPQNCTQGTGINRIMGNHAITLTNRIMSLKEYTADIQRFRDINELKFIQDMEHSQKRINLVELNYSNPSRDPFHAGKRFGVRDIMVPIQGKNGTIYIGRAYTGQWASSTQFKSSGKVAWFFLDFSRHAVEEQRSRNF
jgi:hypothetical protein